MYEYTIYVPTTYNDGAIIPTTDLEKIRVDIVRNYGAYTCDATPVQGYWQDEATGIESYDRIIRYTIVGEKLEELIGRTKISIAKLLKQKVVYVTRTPVTVL